MEVTMKISVFCGVTQCSLVEHCCSKMPHIPKDSSKVFLISWGGVRLSPTWYVGH
jgi:hypothetical protein